VHIPTAALYLLWRCLLYRVTLEWHRDPNAAVTAHSDVLARSLLTPPTTPTAYYAYYTYSYYAYTYTYYTYTYYTYTYYTYCSPSKEHFYAAELSHMRMLDERFARYPNRCFDGRLGG
tara:strand:+ start:144 stop:497 length:354 start_codon:yes stop_codon:yes gene_type:complete